MGWLFGRKRDDVVDLTMLERKGLIKRSQQTSAAESSGGVLDFTSGSTNNSSTSSGYGSSDSSSSGASALGFLSNLASVGASSTTSSDASSSSYGSYSDRLRESRKSNVAEFNSLKIKLEDTEYKLEQALERIRKLEEKIGY